MKIERRGQKSNTKRAKKSKCKICQIKSTFILPKGIYSKNKILKKDIGDHKKNTFIWDWSVTMILYCVIYLLFVLLYTVMLGVKCVDAFSGKMVVANKNIWLKLSHYVLTIRKRFYTLDLSKNPEIKFKNSSNEIDLYLPLYLWFVPTIIDGLVGVSCLLLNLPMDPWVEFSVSSSW